MSIFSPTSGASQRPALIPNGTLAFANVRVREIKKSQSTGGEYADLELTIAEGDYANRKIWEMIANPLDEKNSEKWRQMSVTSLTRIFESTGVFKVDDPASYDKLNGQSFLTICQYLDLSRVGIKVRVEKDKEGVHDDKNKVAEYLSPNPSSGSYTNWKKLLEGNSAANEAARVGAFGIAPAPSQAVGSAPAWLNQPR